MTSQASPPIEFGAISVWDATSTALPNLATGIAAVTPNVMAARYDTMSVLSSQAFGGNRTHARAIALQAPPDGELGVYRVMGSMWKTNGNTRLIPFVGLLSGAAAITAGGTAICANWFPLPYNGTDWIPSVEQTLTLKYVKPAAATVEAFIFGGIVYNSATGSQTGWVGLSMAVERLD